MFYTLIKHDFLTNQSAYNNCGLLNNKNPHIEHKIVVIY